MVGSKSGVMVEEKQSILFSQRVDKWDCRNLGKAE